MSWEDCGFKPGKIDGPAECPKGECGDCDGGHHFIASSGMDEEEEGAGNRPIDFEPEMFFVCKHCGTRATMVDEDEEAEDERNPHQRRCACVREDAVACMAARSDGPNLFDDPDDTSFEPPERCECACHYEIEDERRELHPEPWEMRP